MEPEFSNFIILHIYIYIDIHSIIIFNITPTTINDGNFCVCIYIHKILYNYTIVKNQLYYYILNYTRYNIILYIFYKLYHIINKAYYNLISLM